MGLVFLSVLLSFPPIYTPIKIMESLLCHILSALTAGSSDELARTQQHKHVPISVLVVDVEPLGGAQQLWKKTEEMREKLVRIVFSSVRIIPKMPPTLNDPVFVFTLQCFFFFPLYLTHHHLVLRDPPPPNPRSPTILHSPAVVQGNFPHLLLPHPAFT